MTGFYNRMVRGFLKASENLADVTDPAAARQALGLGGLALKNDGDLAAVAHSGAYADLSGRPQPMLTVPILAHAPAFATWSAVPAAETMFLGSGRWNQVVRADLTNYTQVRLCVVVGAAGVPGTKLIAKYATTFSTLITGYANIGTAEVSVPASTGSVCLTSAWTDLVPAARDDVFLVVTGSGGNGSTSISIGSVHFQFR